LVLAADYPFAIDVLITDSEKKIHQNGMELAECFRVLRPETRVLLAAGNPADEASEWECIPKEFTRSQLINAAKRLTESPMTWAA
jgi:hypothetical protein